jgi:hypothetical protein
LFFAFDGTPVQKENRTRTFISYVNREPDLTLARDLQARITGAGHHCFLAADSIKPGDNWSQRIDSELNQCDYFLVLLSPASLTSDMLIEEVSRAKKLYDDRRPPRPCILPVRVRLPQKADFGYRLGGYLNSFQSINWQSEDDSERILGPILQTVPVDTTLFVRKQRTGSIVRGLTVNLHQSCVQVLKECREFRDKDTLDPLFGIEPLTRYRDALPLEARSQAQLIETVIHNLITYPATRGEALLDLLAILRDKRDHHDPQWINLNELWEQVNMYLNR